KIVLCGSSFLGLECYTARSNGLQHYHVTPSVLIGRRTRNPDKQFIAKMFDSMSGEFQPEPPRDLDEFKRATRRKLSGIRCPRHRRAPQLRFTGESIEDV